VGGDAMQAFIAKQPIRAESHRLSQRCLAVVGVREPDFQLRKSPLERSHIEISSR